MRGRGRTWTVTDTGGGAESRLRDPGDHFLQNPHLTDGNAEARERENDLSR